MKTDPRKRILIVEDERDIATLERAYLTSKGLIIRGVEPYGLPNALRATVGTESQNRQLVEALADFMRA